MIKVEGSSNVAAYDWREVDQGEGNLDVRFHTGETYRYSKVPRGIWERLQSATSKGQYLRIYVINAGYQYVKIATELEAPKTLEERIVDLERKMEKLERQIKI